MTGEDGVDQQRRDLRVGLEQLRQAVRDVGEDAAVGDDRPVKQVLGELVGMLAVPQADVAHLLGVSPRQLQQWLSLHGTSPEGADAARVRIVARAAIALRHTFTGPGVVRWFARPHPRLGHPPADLLDDPLQAPTLTALALSARAQGS